MEEPTMDFRLELIAVPVSDVDRAKAFYTDQAGFNADHDHRVSDELRFVQLTPPGSACSVVVGVGMSDPDAPRVQNLHLVVEGIDEVRAHLAARGVEVSEVQDMGGVKYAYLSDPDGNSWALQQIPR
jgi:catechol 2,3-dioxygenase-like lactoylglutathione lyase family enzyme